MRIAALVIATLLSAPVLEAQSAQATGDARSVAEPTSLLNSPTICAKVLATKWMHVTNTVNIDPYNPTCTGGAGLGNFGCTGGTDYQPSSSNAGYIAAESLDNTAVQAAFNSCPAGQTVELTQGTSGQNAFVLAPINAVNSSGQGIYVLGDMGISVNASRNPSDYGGSGCGTMSTSGTTSCANSWLSETGNGGGYIGYANWYGRGWDHFSSGANQTQSFYEQRGITYYVAHGGATEGSPACPGSLCSPAYKISYGPDGLHIGGSSDSATVSNFTVYKMTLRDSPGFLSTLDWVSGATYWDAKLFDPFWVSNTDGFDTVSSQNVTFAHGYVSTGDNDTAFKASAGANSCVSGSSGSRNISFIDSQVGAGIGLALGTCLTDGESNILFSTLVKNGNTLRGNDTGLEITGSSGTVNKVTYQNICMMNTNRAMQFITSGSTVLTNLYGVNINVAGSNAGSFNFQGTSSNHIQAQLNNAQVAGSLSGSSQNANMYLGTGSVTSSLQSQLGCGSNGVVCTNATSSTPAYTCNSSSSQPLTSEMNIQNPAGLNNNQVYSGAGPIVIQYQVQPTTAINNKESAALSAGVQFYDNGAAIGSPVSLTGDNTVAPYTVSGVPTGTNHYTACYVGDSAYSRFCGSATVTATNGSPTTPLTVTVGGKVVYQGNVVTQ